MTIENITVKDMFAKSLKIKNTDGEYPHGIFEKQVDVLKLSFGEHQHIVGKLIEWCVGQEGHAESLQNVGDQITDWFLEIKFYDVPEFWPNDHLTGYFNITELDLVKGS